MPELQASKAYGGPDGGNGGLGGDIWLSVSNKKTSLSHLKDRYKGNPGANGGSGTDGSNGEPLVINVPLGTLIKSQNGRIIADLNTEESEFMISAGGTGGLGNAFFKSDTNPVPRESTPGMLGERSVVELEYRKISDFGLVGLPNSGKSSLMNNLSDSKSDVSMIAGTTLVPHAGHLVYNDRVVVSGMDIFNLKLTILKYNLKCCKKSIFKVTDLPGIEPKDIPFYFNTSRRAGQFLQHCSRSKSLIYVIDGDPELPFTPLEQFDIIR